MKLTHKLDEIIEQWNIHKNERPLSIPDWCWNQPNANEPYYTFLHLLIQITRAKIVVELGTEHGTSGLFMATALHETKIISIAARPELISDLQKIAQNHKLTNLIPICGWSTVPETVSQATAHGLIDILFIDTEHTCTQATSEYQTYLPYMSSDGIIVHDDIYFSDDMTKYWNSLPNPKRTISELHWTGFGITGGG